MIFNYFMQSVRFLKHLSGFAKGLYSHAKIVRVPAATNIDKHIHKTSYELSSFSHFSNLSTSLQKDIHQNKQVLSYFARGMKTDVKDHEKPENSVDQKTTTDEQSTKSKSNMKPMLTLFCGMIVVILGTNWVVRNFLKLMTNKTSDGVQAASLDPNNLPRDVEGFKNLSLSDMVFVLTMYQDRLIHAHNAAKLIDQALVSDDSQTVSAKKQLTSVLNEERVRVAQLRRDAQLELFARIKAVLEEYHNTHSTKSKLQLAALATALEPLLKHDTTAAEHNSRSDIVSALTSSGFVDHKDKDASEENRRFTLDILYPRLRADWDTALYIRNLLVATVNGDKNSQLSLPTHQDSLAEGGKVVDTRDRLNTSSMTSIKTSLFGSTAESALRTVDQSMNKLLKNIHDIENAQ